MSVFFLQVKYQGIVVYRKESIKPLVLNEIELEVGAIIPDGKGGKDAALFTRDFKKSD